MERMVTEDTARILASLEAVPLSELLQQAAAMRLAGHGNVISYSRKVFIPLTQLCRDVCGYCTFAKAPREVAKPYLSPDDVLAIARAGEKAGCREALFTLGDKPELRYGAAREALNRLGFDTTVDYLEAVCALVLKETSLLPHINAGVMDEYDIARLRKVSVSQGIMLETVSARLGERGGAHFGSPDKDPQLRLAMIAAAGRQRVPFTSGILIGIGETRLERIESLLALKALHDAHGHLQEIIVQNFRAKAGTRFAGCEEPDTRRPAVDRGCGATAFRPTHEHPGAAEPELRGVSAIARFRHQRLGWNLPGDGRSRQPGGAVARSRQAPIGDRTSGDDTTAAARDLSGLCRKSIDLARPFACNPGAAGRRRRRVRPRGQLDAGLARASAGGDAALAHRSRPRRPAADRDGGRTAGGKST